MVAGRLPAWVPCFSSAVSCFLALMNPFGGFGTGSFVPMVGHSSFRMGHRHAMRAPPSNPAPAACRRALFHQALSSTASRSRSSRGRKPLLVHRLGALEMRVSSSLRHGQAGQGGAQHGRHRHGGGHRHGDDHGVEEGLGSAPPWKGRWRRRSLRSSRARSSRSPARCLRAMSGRPIMAPTKAPENLLSDRWRIATKPAR